MSIKFACISPHPVVMMPNIGKECSDQMVSTKQALNKLGDKLKSVLPQRIIVISPHGKIFEKAFSVNVNDSYVGTFEEFGDFTTKTVFIPDFEMITWLKQFCQNKKIPLNMVTQKLDYGSSVPLIFLSSQELLLNNIPITPIHYSNSNAKTHYEFGKCIKEILSKDEKRTAIVASADLSHKLLKKSPAGFHKQAIEYDKKLIDALNNNDIEKIIKMEDKLMQMGVCGYKAIMILLGILDGTNVKFKLHSYEYPLGVGYLVADYEF